MSAPIRRRSLLKGILGGVAAVAAGGAVASRVEARDTAPTITISGPIAEPVSITNESLHATLGEMSGEPWVTYRGGAADHTRRMEFGPFSDGRVSAQDVPDMTVRIRALPYVGDDGLLRRYEGTEAFAVPMPADPGDVPRLVIYLDNRLNAIGVCVHVPPSATPLALLNVYPGMAAITDADLTDWRDPFLGPHSHAYTIPRLGDLP